MNVVSLEGVRAASGAKPCLAATSDVHMRHHLLGIGPANTEEW